MSTTTPDLVSRIQFPEAVTDERRLEATQLVAAIAAAREALHQFPAPHMGTRFALEPGETVEDYGGEANAPVELVCPWCRKTVRADALYDLEISERRTYASEIDSSEQVVEYHYDGRCDYDSITYIHELCDKPVAVPPGWDVSC